jgi:hypothetical protein
MLYQISIRIFLYFYEETEDWALKNYAQNSFTLLLFFSDANRACLIVIFCDFKETTNSRLAVFIGVYPKVML